MVNNIILEILKKYFIYVFLSVLKKKHTKIKVSGDDNEEEIPVPMPNTEVKLLSAEDTYELPCWENRKSPDFFMPFYSKFWEYIINL